MGGRLTIGAHLCYRWEQQKQRDFARLFNEFIKNLYVSYVYANSAIKLLFPVVNEMQIYFPTISRCMN
jgi:hypothetical protein